MKVDASDGSIAWTKRLTTYSDDDTYPSTCAYNSYIYIAWTRYYSSYGYEVMLQKVDASDGSIAWTKRLTLYSDNDRYPSICAYNGYIYITWERYYSSYEVMLMKVDASDGSIAWIKRLTTYSDKDNRPSVCAYNGYIYVAWERYYSGYGYEIMLQKVSATDGSIAWTKRLTTYSNSDEYPSVCAYNGYIYVAWYRYYGGNYEIMLMKIGASDGSMAWIKRVTTYGGSDAYPRVCAYNGYIYIAWHRFYGSWEIMLASVNSSTGDVCWVDFMCSNDVHDTFPDVCVGENYVYVVWQAEYSKYEVVLEKCDGGQ